LRPRAERAPVKEDILEQIVDDYLQFNGYFTTHNVRFRPRPDHPEFNSREDSVNSDVDVVGYHPTKTGVDRVIVVTCKAWQGGFGATAKLAELRGEKRNPKRATWHHFRELWVPKWSEAFRAKIEDLTGHSTFSYRIAVTHLKGDGDAWKSDPTITANLGGSTFGFLTLEGKCSGCLRWHPRVAGEQSGEGVDGGDAVLAGRGQVAA
jgi:hypothetical protein